MRPSHQIIAVLLVPVFACCLAACGAPRKSVFPPSLSVQQMEVKPNGEWRLSLRIQNNSYTSMDFTGVDGTLAVASFVPLRIHASFERDIPQLASDLVDVDVLPTPQMNAALAAVDAKGSRGSLAYSLAGTTTATPADEKQARGFPFHNDNWLSPVPGMAHNYR